MNLISDWSMECGASGNATRYLIDDVDPRQLGPVVVDWDGRAARLYRLTQAPDEAGMEAFTTASYAVPAAGSWPPQRG